MTRQSSALARRAGAEIAGLLASRNLTRGDLARMLGVSNSGVTRRLAGDTPLDFNEVERIAAWLDVPVTRIIHPPDDSAYTASA